MTGLKRQLSGGLGAALLFAAATGGVEATIIGEQRSVPAPAAAVAATNQHHVFGWLVSVTGNVIALQLRSGRVLQINAAQAAASKRVSEPLYRGKPTVVTGNFGSGGVFYATSITRATPHSAVWGADR